MMRRRRWRRFAAGAFGTACGPVCACGAWVNLHLSVRSLGTAPEITTSAIAIRQQLLFSFSWFFSGFS